MDRMIILGSGSAAGVPTISAGWGNCNPENPKNRRSRAGVYVEIGDTKILIDTSADLRNQLIDNHIEHIDAVLYTHTHADHTAGIDDLRAMTYHHSTPLNVYATAAHMQNLHERFAYVFNDYTGSDATHRPLLKMNIIRYRETFRIGDIEILPLEFAGHPMPTTGFLLNRGKILLVPDYKYILPETMAVLEKFDVDVLIMPLTNIDACPYHAGMEDDMRYIKQINPQKVFFTHMSQYCDYDAVEAMSAPNMHPANDGLIIDL